MVGRYKGKTILALPYSGDRFVMYLFIPHNIKQVLYILETPSVQYRNQYISICEIDFSCIYLFLIISSKFQIIQRPLVFNIETSIYLFVRRFVMYLSIPHNIKYVLYILETSSVQYRNQYISICEIDLSCIYLFLIISSKFHIYQRPLVFNIGTSIYLFVRQICHVSLYSS